MSRLPRFTSQAQVQQGGIADASFGARSLTELGQRIQQFGSQQLIRTQTQRAQVQGEMAGMDPNFRPARFGGIATQAFNQAALATNRTLMATDAILGTQKNKFEAMRSSPDANVQAQIFKQLQSQYANQMVNQAPDANKAVVQNVLMHQSGQSLLGFQKQSFKQEQIKIAMQSIQTDNATRNAEIHQINNINWSGDPELVQKQIAAAGQYLKQRTDAITLRALGGQLHPDEAGRMIKSAKKEFNENVITGQFTAIASKDPEKALAFINFVRNPKLPANGFGKTKQLLNSYGPDERRVFAGHLQKVLNQQLRTQHVNAASFTQRMADDQRAILNGAVPNPQLHSDIKIYAPKLLPKFERMVSDAQVVSADVKTILSAPLSSQDEIYASMRPTQKGSGAEFGRDIGNWEKVGSMLAAARKQQKDNPVAYHLNQPEMSGVLNESMTRNQVGANFEEIGGGGWKPPPVNVMRHLVLSQSNYTGNDDSKASVLTNNQATGMVSQFNSLSNVVEKAQLMQRWSQEAGPYFPNMVRDLIDRGKMSPDSMFLIGVGPNSADINVYDKLTTVPRKELISSAEDVDPDVNKQIIKGQFNSHFQQYVDSLRAYSPGPGNIEDHIESTKKFMQDYAMSSMITGNPVSSAKKAWQNAQDTFASRFNYGEIDGRTIRVPKKYDIQSVIKYLNANKVTMLKNFNFNLNPNYAANMTAAEAKRQTFDTLITSGGFVTNNTNDSMIFIDQDGKAITDNHGNNLIVKLSDIPINNKPHEAVDIRQTKISQRNRAIARASLGLDPVVKKEIDPIGQLEDVVSHALDKIGLARTPPQTRSVAPGIRRAHNATG